jgi:hypothetical protein
MALHILLCVYHAGLVRAEEVHKVTTQAAIRLEYLQHERTWNVIRLEHREEARDASNAPHNADERNSSSNGGGSTMQGLEDRHVVGSQLPSGGSAGATAVAPAEGSHRQPQGAGASSQAWSVHEDLQHISALWQRGSTQRM